MTATMDDAERCKLVRDGLAHLIKTKVLHVSGTARQVLEALTVHRGRNPTLWTAAEGIILFEAWGLLEQGRLVITFGMAMVETPDP